jgi:hypothetical protein
MRHVPHGKGQLVVQGGTGPIPLRRSQRESLRLAPPERRETRAVICSGEIGHFVKSKIGDAPELYAEAARDVANEAVTRARLNVP